MRDMYCGACPSAALHQRAVLPEAVAWNGGDNSHDGLYLISESAIYFGSAV